MIFKLDIAIVIGLVFMAVNNVVQKKSFHLDSKASVSLFLLIVCISVASKFGSYGNGLGYINTQTELVLLFAISLVVCLVSTKSSFKNDDIKKHITKYENDIGIKTEAKKHMPTQAAQAAQSAQA